MPFSCDDVDENILDRFSIEFLIFQKFFKTVRDPTECNFGVVSQQQNTFITRIDCVNLLPSNYLDFLILTVILL